MFGIKAWEKKRLCYILLYCKGLAVYWSNRQSAIYTAMILSSSCFPCFLRIGQFMTLNYVLSLLLIIHPKYHQ